MISLTKINLSIILLFQDPRWFHTTATCHTETSTCGGGGFMSARSGHEYNGWSGELSTLAGPGLWAGGYSAHTGQWSVRLVLTLYHTIQTLNSLPHEPDF